MKNKLYTIIIEYIIVVADKNHLNAEQIAMKQVLNQNEVPEISSYEIIDETDIPEKNWEYSLYYGDNPNDLSVREFIELREQQNLHNPQQLDLFT